MASYKRSFGATEKFTLYIKSIYGQFTLILFLDRQFCNELTTNQDMWFEPRKELFKIENKFELISP